jgi:flagellar motility protein MotE (MotC chaperone)
MIGGSKILPVLMVAAALCFGVRFSEMIKDIAAAGSFEAYAATSRYEGDLNRIETAAGEEPPPQSELKGSDEVDAPDKPEAPAVETGEKVPAPGDEPAGRPQIDPPSLGDAPKEGWKDSGDVDDEYSDVRMELFADLSKRRKDLESKEKELVLREALLKAAQAELTQKTNELTTIKADIEALLKKQTEQEDQRIASLVKIYEGMKAKDAARIFDSLEMDVLLQVMTKMSERKSAPILAAMSPEKARNVTIMLAEQNKLPALPTLPVEQ